MKRILTLSILLLVTTLSFSQQIQEKEIYTYANATMVEELFDFKEITYESIKFNTYKAKLKGFNVFVEIDDGDLFLTTYFNGDISLNRVNDINSQYRWIRAYLDKDADLTIKADLSFTGGISILNINSFINTYGAILEEIAK